MWGQLPSAVHRAELDDFLLFLPDCGALPGATAEGGCRHRCRSLEPRSGSNFRSITAVLCLLLPRHRKMLTDRGRARSPSLDVARRSTTMRGCGKCVPSGCCVLFWAWLPRLLPKIRERIRQASSCRWTPCGAARRKKTRPASPGKCWAQIQAARRPTIFFVRNTFCRLSA